MPNNKKRIEVEVRSIFNEDKYNEIKGFLSAHAIDLGEDDRETVFFIIPDKTLKVTKNVSKNNAKISLKVGNINTGQQEEIEISIDLLDFNNAVKIFQVLGFDEIQYTLQKRHNYLYEGIELALKFSNDWGYHLEAEMVVDSEDRISEANIKIKELYRKLHLKPLTEREIDKMRKKIDSRHRENMRKTDNGTII